MKTNLVERLPNQRVKTDTNVADVLSKPFETIGDLTLRAFDALFPIQAPPPPPPPKPPAPPAAPEPEPPDGFLIGTEPRTKEKIYALNPQLDRHLLIIGGTGCGKTTLIARLFTQEILKWR